MKKLLAVRGFLPLVCVVYLNAFIDLGHKIVIQNTLFKIHDGSEQIILTAIVNSLILLPFILLFHGAGKTSDGYAKASVLKTASIANVFLTACLSLCYWQGWFWPAFAFTFLMGAQSAYYGPAKYGLLKELVSNQDLSLANGIAQALATVGILSGILCFSILFEIRYTDVVTLDSASVMRVMTPLGLLLVGISIVECLIAWTLPVIKPAISAKEVTTSQPLSSLLKSPVVFPAIIGLSVFWSVGQMLLAIYPAFAKTGLGITNTIVIQGLLAIIGIGIMAGSVLAGRLSKNHIEMALVPTAGAGVILLISVLPTVTEVPAAFLVFFCIGVAGGLFMVPLNALVQYCTAPEKLGITIAQSNLIQNIAMFGCLVITVVAALWQLSAKNLLFFIAISACLGILFVVSRMPFTLQRFSKRVKKKLVIEGFDSISGHGALLLLTDHAEERYHPYIQMAYPRKILFSLPGKWDENSCACIERHTAENCDMPPLIQIVNLGIEENSDRILLRFAPA